MTTLRLDKNNNIVVEGDMCIIDGADALVQDIKTMIALQPKEYIYNTTKGVDWIKYLQSGDTAELLNNIENEVYSDTRVKECQINTNKNNGSLILNINTVSNEEVIVNVE